MPLRVALHRITTSRDGKRVTVQPGEAFQFTDEEIGELETADPPSIRAAVREAVLAEEDHSPAPAPVRRRREKTSEDDL